MPRLSLAFFFTAAIYGLFGMAWGSMMGASGDHSMLAPHAHLNLLGWASLGIMGGFYALARDQAPARLGWINFTLSNLGVLLMVPSMAMLLKGDLRFVPVQIVGELCTMTGLVTFLVVVLLTARRRRVAV